MNFLDYRGLTGLSTDTMVDGRECGRERPDRVFDFGDKIVILECDENQHRERACLCEQTRMVNLGQAFGGLPVYFLRWNPDDYAPRKEKSVPETLTNRHRLCGDLIEDIRDEKMDLPGQSLVSALYLYYDGWQSLSSEKWVVLTPTRKSDALAKNFTILSKASVERVM